MPFQPGNDLATKHGQWRAALNRAIAQDDGKRLRGAAEKLLTLASEGESWAVRELGDRLDGKAAQAVTIVGDPEQPLESRITVEFVGAAHSTNPGST